MALDVTDDRLAFNDASTRQVPYAPHVRFGVLGPLTVNDGDRALQVRGRKERTVLAILLASPGQLVTADVLTDLLWDGTPPPTAVRALHVYVTRLRRVVESSDNGPSRVLPRCGSGWLLDVAPDDLDSIRFERRSLAGGEALRRGRFVEASRDVEEALSEWRGPAFADFPDVLPCAREADRLAELRVVAQEDAVDAALALGAASELVPSLERAVQQAPLRERTWAQLMLALYRSGRQGDALAAYQRVRRVLDGELGTEPGPALRRLQEDILQQAPSLTTPLQHVTCRGSRPSNPFKGLTPYTGADAGLLLSRERLVARLAQCLPVCLVGESGSGKSSVLHAGLLPALSRGVVPGSQRWRVVTATPGDCAPERLPAADGSDLVVVDQLEELFTQCDDAGARQEYVDRLVSLVARGIGLALAVRSDFWPQCAALPRLGELITANSMLVGPLTEDETRLVVTEGARLGGAAVDPDLVDALANDVAGRPGALPLLSTALAETWRRRVDDRLTLDGYRAAGGVEGAIASLAEEAYAGLTDVERSAARRILVRLADDGPAGVPVRRRAPVLELAPGPDTAAGTALERLVGGRLVVVGEHGAEVAHEALFTRWPRLASWLTEDATARRLRDRLTPAAMDWDARGRPDADLLRGPRLAEALEETDRHPESLIPVERDYLAESARFADAERLEMLDRNARERRAVRRLRRSLAAVAVLLVGALIATAVAVSVSGRARRAATDAEARRLGAQALLETRPDLALQLAAAAVRLRASPDTEGDLLAALVRTRRALRITNLGTRLLAVAVSSDGRSLAVGDNRGSVRLLDAATLRPLRTLVRGNGYPVTGLAFVVANRRLVSAEQLPAGGAQLAIRDVAAGRLVAHVRVADAFNVGATPDADGVVSGSYGGGYLWLPGSRRLVSFGANEGVTGFTPDNHRFAVVDDRGGTALYDDRGRVLRRLPRARSEPVAALSPDGRVLATTLLAGGIVLWDTRSGAQVGQLAGHAASVTSIAFSPSGRLLLSADGDGTAIVWDVRDAAPLARMPAGSGWVAAAFSRDERTAYTAAQDGTLATWDLTGTRGFGTSARLPGPVAAAAFAPDGRRVVLGTPTGLVVCDGTSLRVAPGAADATSGLASAACGAVSSARAGAASASCTATDEAGNSATATAAYVVQYAISPLLSPAAGSRWKAGATMPVKVRLTDVKGTRIPNAEAAALGCRVVFTASGAQPASGCLTYHPTGQLFQYDWKLGKATGAATVAVSASYPGTTSGTVRSTAITITR